MASTYSSIKIQLMSTGENTTTWGDVTNVNLGTAIEEAIVGSADVTFASANVTLTLTDTNATQTARNMRLRCTGTTGGSTRNLVVPSIEKPYIVKNDCADSVVVKTAAGTGITVPAGKSAWVYADGTNVVDVTTHLTSLTLGTPLAVADGGTGANTAAAARTALSAAASGANTDITTMNPTGGLQVGSPTGGAKGTGTINATGLYINGSAVGTGSGSVTSVNASGGTTGLSFSGGPITTSGTLTLAGTLVVANGGTGATTLTGIVKGNGTSAMTAAVAGTDYVVPSGALGTPSSGTLTNCTFPTLNQNTTGSAGSIATANFSIVETGGVLYIKYGATNIAKITSAGAFTALNNVTGFGTV